MIILSVWGGGVVSVCMAKCHLMTVMFTTKSKGTNYILLSFLDGKCHFSCFIFDPQYLHSSILDVCVFSLSGRLRLMSTVRDRDGVTGVIRNPLPLPAHPSESRLLSSFSRMMCEAFLRGKAKQTGRPKSLPLRGMSQPPQPPQHPSALDPSHSHHSTHPQSLSQEKERWRLAWGGRGGGGGEGGSDCYSVNVTTSQREPHDTATKSELMDSFLTPVNMTGGVCESEGVWEQNGGWRGCLIAPLRGHRGQRAPCVTTRGKRVFQGN